MKQRDFQAAARFVLPQAITAGRLILGIGALTALLHHNTSLAAHLIVIGVVTDAWDGSVARRLNITSDFGTFFDLVTDYLCYIVVPAMLTLVMAQGRAGIIQICLLALPFLTGALRYARLAELSRHESCERDSSPGLGTVMYAFYVIALVFLEREGAVDLFWLVRIAAITVPFFSILMLVPVQYPKLAKRNTFLIPAVLGLNLMPFLFTVFWATMTISVILAYVSFSPMMIRQRPNRAALPPPIR
jgi:CDP-diacylglycerol--serine O-phosphatidyltransferase